VVWFDRPWLGESPADIDDFNNSAFNFILNEYVLSCSAPKAFKFAESFSKPVILPLTGFQKRWAPCCPLFKRELFIGNLFAGFQNRQDCPWPVFKSSRCNSETSVVQ
jgi:hypothetical protein